jgi:hypothetical protein
MGGPTSGRPSPSPRRTSTCPEIKQAIAFQRLHIDGKVLLDDASATGHQDRARTGVVAARRRRALQGQRGRLRRALFEETGGMYPELVTRSDIEVFLPPIGGQTLYIFGEPA